MVLEGHTNVVMTVKFDPSDPNILFSGGYDTDVRVFDIAYEKKKYRTGGRGKNCKLNGMKSGVWTCLKGTKGWCFACRFVIFWNVNFTNIIVIFFPAIWRIFIAWSGYQPGGGNWNVLPKSGSQTVLSHFCMLYRPTAYVRYVHFDVISHIF